MSDQRTAARLARRKTEVTLVPAESLDGRAMEVHGMVGRRAYELFLERSGDAGHDLEDWLRAESEVLCRVPVGLMQTADSLTINAGLAGCGIDQLQIAVDPHSLILSGRAEAPGGWREPAPIYQIIPLPVPVVPGGAVLRFENGILEIRIPKA